MVPSSPPLVIVVMGVSGCGKSTVAGLLAGRLGWDLQEGDDLHPPENVAKMESGEPLTDTDRGPWLAKVAQWIADHTTREEPGVITCSALKRSYRDRLRGDRVVFVHLSGTRDLLLSRMSKRMGHFMPASLLDSQLATLEPLGPDEAGIVVPLGDSPGEDVSAILTLLGLSAESPVVAHHPPPDSTE